MRKITKRKMDGVEKESSWMAFVCIDKLKKMFGQLLRKANKTLKKIMRR